MLAPKILKYLNHKLLLAKVSSHYQAPDKKQALDWAYSLQQFFKYQGKHLSDREVAYMMLQHQSKLEQLLPNPLNKSYKSSITNLENIKTLCKSFVGYPKNQSSSNLLN
jgi:hypothetical protein